MPTALLVAHGFPPAGGSGSNRVLAFSRYLPLWGWRPLVLTVDSAWAANRDDGLLRMVPADLEVVRTRSWEAPSNPVRAGQGPSLPSVARATFLRKHVGHLKRLPDAHVGWLPFAVAAGRRLQFDVIHSSSGPFTSHLVGLLLHRLTGKPWVAELRDGWYLWNRAIFPDYPAWRGPLEQRLEHTVIRTAQRVVLVTERMANVYRQQYADLPREHFAVVSNGFDPVEFATEQAAATPPPATARRDTFQVLHAGALYYGRSVAALLAAVQRLCAEDPAFAAAFRLTLLGTLDATARAEVDRAGLGDRVQFKGYLEHTQTIAAMRQADALLLVANTTQGAEATVPGKLFEYLAVGQPVLAIAPRESSASDVIAHTGGGWVATADDVDSIACTLHQAFHAHKAHQAPRATTERLQRFDRRHLARELATIFDELHAAHRL